MRAISFSGNDNEQKIITALNEIEALAKASKPLKNTCLKTRDKSQPYEVWTNGTFTWYVLKKWQTDDNKAYARWYCYVTSPFCGQNSDGSMGGEYGDVYVSEIKQYGYKIA